RDRPQEPARTGEAPAARRNRGTRALPGPGGASQAKFRVPQQATQLAALALVARYVPASPEHRAWKASTDHARSHTGQALIRDAPAWSRLARGVPCVASEWAANHLAHSRATPRLASMRRIRLHSTGVRLSLGTASPARCRR